jgi:hypothetical protein
MVISVVTELTLFILDSSISSELFSLEVQYSVIDPVLLQEDTGLVKSNCQTEDMDTFSSY